ncbi:ABC transporter permease, partial [Staphylococcus arlettae]
MKTFQLFRIYHSFLLKKWYLLLYIFVIIIAAFGTLLIIQQSQQDNTTFNIGVVDEDDTKETRLILKSLGNGNNLGKDIRITPYTQRQAHKKLQQHQLDGYYVFKDGMTKTFYRNGSLPITVYTYDKQST